MSRRTRKKVPMRLLSPTEQVRWDAEARLQEVVAELGSEEIEVLCRLAGRLLLGQKTYGRLTLGAGDPRDFEEERADEIADVILYSGFLELQRVLRRRREASHGALRQLAKRTGRG